MLVSLGQVSERLVLLAVERRGFGDALNVVHVARVVGADEVQGASAALVLQLRRLRAPQQVLAVLGGVVAQFEIVGEVSLMMMAVARRKKQKVLVVESKLLLIIISHPMCTVFEGEGLFHRDW